jgi:hypothetical protein
MVAAPWSDHQAITGIAEAALPIDQLSNCLVRNCTGVERLGRLTPTVSAYESCPGFQRREDGETVLRKWTWFARVTRHTPKLTGRANQVEITTFL